MGSRPPTPSVAWSFASMPQPDGRLVVAEQSGYFIPGDQPDLVIDAIRQVVEAVRDPSTWATPQAAPSV